MVKQLVIDKFPYGLIDSIEDSSVPRGTATSELNWLTQGVKIELRRGMALLGTTENTGTGRITGLGVALKPNGDEVVLRTRKQKVEYLDTTTDDWVEIGTNILPAAVIADDSLGEDISIQPYQNLTGYQVWLNSPNTGPYKIMTANMASYLDLNSSRNYMGKMRIKSNRQFLWDRGGITKDKINIYGSKLDTKNDDDYTTVTAEAIAGSGTGRSGTLGFKGSDTTGKDFTVVAATDIFTSSAHGFDTGDIVRLSSTTTLPAGLSSTVNYYVSKIGADTFYLYTDARLTTKANATDTGTGTHTAKLYGALRTCFAVTFTDGTETFTDNGDGTLTGSAGGTGTINYTTGAYAITFAASATTVTATYQWVDDTDGGIADFGFSATRAAGEGFIRLQGASGNFQNIASYNFDEYCFHENKTWLLDIATDDSTVNSIIYRDRVGIPNHRAMVETGDGVYYIDDTDKNNPHFRLMRLTEMTGDVIPVSISKQRKVAEINVGVDLTGYYFDRGVSIEFGDLVLFACRTTNSSTNNRVFVYNKVSKAFDIVDYYVSCFAIYDGTLIAGDDVSDNVYTLFSGTDDDQSSIGNHWEGSLDNLDNTKMKRLVEIIVDGEIAPEQSIKISISLDGGSFVEVRSQEDVTNDKHAIEGDGYYVDTSQRVDVGSYTLGRGEVGGGGSGLEAYHYRRQFRVSLDKFEFIKIRFETTRLGYASVSEFIFHDVRIKFGKVINRYRENK